MNNDGSSSTSKQVENIVLVGRTGNGKSATANSLIGKKRFESKAHATGMTMECQSHVAVTRDGHTINVIDTPGLFDLSVSAEFISKEIVRCLTLAEGGIHAVILVLSVRNKITQEDENTLRTLQTIFGSEIRSYVIVVFTGGDDLEECNETLEDYLGRNDCSDFIKEVVRMSSNRVVLFNNRTHDEDKKADQVHKLLSLVDDIRRSNNGQAYTDDMYHKIKEHTEKIREEHEQMESKNNSADPVAELNAAFFDTCTELLSGGLAKMIKETMEDLEKKSAQLRLENEAEEEKKRIAERKKENDNLFMLSFVPVIPPPRMGEGCSIQ